MEEGFTVSKFRENVYFSTGIGVELAIGEVLNKPTIEVIYAQPSVAIGEDVGDLENRLNIANELGIKLKLGMPIAYRQIRAEGEEDPIRVVRSLEKKFNIKRRYSPRMVFLNGEELGPEGYVVFYTQQRFENNEPIVVIDQLRNYARFVRELARQSLETQGELKDFDLGYMMNKVAIYTNLSLEEENDLKGKVAWME